MPELHLATEDPAPFLSKMKKSESELSPVSPDVYFDPASPEVSPSNAWRVNGSFGLLRETV